MLSGNLSATVARLSSGDPRFVNPNHGNLRLRDDSPLIDARMAAVGQRLALDLDG